MKVKMLRIVGAVMLACAVMCVSAAPAFAAGPKLRLHVLTPDSVKTTDTMTVRMWVQNVGDGSTEGPIHFTNTFGSGVTNVKTLGATGLVSSSNNVSSGPTECENGTVSVSCVIEGPLVPGAQVQIEVATTFSHEATGTISDTISVSGGGTSGTVQEERTISIDNPGPFGFTGAAVELPNNDGVPDVQAASPPAEYTTKLVWKSFYSDIISPFPGTIDSVDFFKDVVAHLPPGLIGNPSASTLCKTDELAQFISQDVTKCPADSQVGIVRVGIVNGYFTAGLYNMVAPYGSAAELGFNILNTVILLGAYVRPGDHGIDIVTRDTTTTLSVSAAEITVWGVPADASHDGYRGTCLISSPPYSGPNGLACPTSAQPQAFLRTPTSCTGSPLAFGFETNSYVHPDTWATANTTGPRMAACDLVPFDPSVTVDPTGTATNSPTGVSVKLSLPQSRGSAGQQEADLKKAVVTLPEGMAINPSSADGLQACGDAQLHLDSNTPAECPDGSKIGTVLLHTQLIPNPIEGDVFLRTQNSSDPASGEMFRMVIELRDDAHGLDFKIPGQISANPVTGRLTTTFDDNPQFPFEDISLRFKAGARAPLVTPVSCETQTTEANLYSWAEPDVPVHRSSSFALTSGPEGTPCVARQGFNPSMDAGVSSVQAGGFTPFLVTFSRKDADQSMQRVSVKMPKGLLGSLVGLPLCPEAQANAGSCSQASEIGSVTAGAGAGPTPFYVTGGKVFMTGPYEGAPFGLSVVVPAKAGPFDLGLVVVRAKVEVDVHTAQLTVTTDPLPQIVGGVPVNLRLVNVTINRPNFTYNPTDCNPTAISGTMTGGQGAVAALSNRFQVTNCGALKFQPKFSVSTSGKTSRANGASLDAKLTYPKTGQGTQANIARVKVSLPKQLPSRLTTLQKACTAATFEANPAACPSASRIGTVRATTPVLPVPLSGPVYFVSHGGEAFPDLVVVLQGYGVTVDLVGTTFINKAGITSTTFKTVPDVPVGTFELKLPQGKFSALAANGNLCTSNLKMPTAFVAQDGAEIHQSTPIAVTGCPKHKAKKAQAGRRSKSKKNNKKK